MCAYECFIPAYYKHAPPPPPSQSAILWMMLYVFVCHIGTLLS